MDNPSAGDAPQTRGDAEQSGYPPDDEKVGYFQSCLVQTTWMRRLLQHFGGLPAGATLGGLIAGTLEAAYRGVPTSYAALLYGALWAAAGVVISIAAKALWHHEAPPRHGFALGLGTSLALSLGVLVRFVAFRDFFHEAPGKTWLALALGAGAALLVIAGLILTTRAIERRFVAENLGGRWLWLIPSVIIAAFAWRARSADEVVPETPPPASHALTGRGVILVVVDALRADALGVYGAPPHDGKPASAAIDSFAKSARVFTRANAQASWTRPAVASLFTSRLVSGHRTMAKDAVLPYDLPTVASVLKAAGVYTAAVVTNFNLEPAYGFDRGFDDYRYLAPARYLGAPRDANRLAAYDVYRLLRERFLGRYRQSRFFYRSAAAVNAQALSILDAVGDGTFFLYLHYMEPHDPYFAQSGDSYARVSKPKPAPEWAPAMRSAYADEVQRFDDAFAQLMAGLRQRGLAERTTVVLTADHGEEFGDHGGFYHGLTLYQELLHVPLLLAGPGVPAGIDEQLARQIDIAPTLLGRFGVKAPPSWEGHDLVGDGLGATLSVAEEDHEGNVLRSIISGADKLILANPDNPRGLDPLELYNLSQDPHERHMLKDDERAGRLEQLLQHELAEARRGAGHAQHRAPDESVQAELRSLGYVQ
jgi:arylsulfatase A-like enzyme